MLLVSEFELKNVRSDRRGGSHVTYCPVSFEWAGLASSTRNGTCQGWGVGVGPRKYCGQALLACQTETDRPARCVGQAQARQTISPVARDDVTWTGNSGGTSLTED
ncbi:hypothetical protein Bbelb_079090 [Branchiostoma belcheri]|nr:hypothetical protein Bbelb_079090 [Branchiostoma belcheri]